MIQVSDLMSSFRRHRNKRVVVQIKTQHQSMHMMQAMNHTKKEKDKIPFP